MPLHTLRSPLRRPPVAPRRSSAALHATRAAHTFTTAYRFRSPIAARASATLFRPELPDYPQSFSLRTLIPLLRSLCCGDLATGITRRASVYGAPPPISAETSRSRPIQTQCPHLESPAIQGFSRAGRDEKTRIRDRKSGKKRKRSSRSTGPSRPLACGRHRRRQEDAAYRNVAGGAAAPHHQCIGLLHDA